MASKDFEISRIEKSLSVVLTGNLITEIIPDLKAALLTALEKETDGLVFDFSHISLVDSSGIGLLIAAYNSLSKTGGSIQVINANTQITELLTSMRLSERFNMNKGSDKNP